MGRLVTFFLLAAAMPGAVLGGLLGHLAFQSEALTRTASLLRPGPSDGGAGTYLLVACLLLLAASPLLWWLPAAGRFSRDPGRR